MKLHTSIKIILIFSLLLSLVYQACKKEGDLAKPENLTVSHFYPNAGQAGTIVTLEGTGFGTENKDIQILFNDQPGTITSVEGNKIFVLAPENGKSGQITLKKANQTLDVGTYSYQNLSIREMSPINGSAGTNIFIYGSGFSSLDDKAKATVNSKEASVISVSDSLIVIEVPQAAGTGQVEIQVDGFSVKGPVFNFQSIGGMKPLSGGAGTLVTINGEGFDVVKENNVVDFNGIKAEIIEFSPTKLIVKAPIKVSSGPVSVRVKGEKTLGQIFTVVPPPIISTVLPSSGLPGTEVRITGDNFSTISGENKVLFGGKEAIIKSNTPKELVLIVPEDIKTGNLIVDVNNQSKEGPEFKNQRLGIKALIPNNGLAGNEIEIQGDGFDKNSIVSFKGKTAIVKDATATSLKVIVPDGVSTGLVSISTGGYSTIGPKFQRAGVETFVGGSTGIEIPEYIFAIAMDSKGNLFIASGTNVYKITPDKKVINFAGPTIAEGGNKDGIGEEARFREISTMSIDKNDNLYLSSLRNVRKITPDRKVTTFFTHSYETIQSVIYINDNLWYLSVGSSTTLNAIDKYGATTTLPYYYTDGIIGQMVQQNSGGILMPGADGKIHRYDPKANQFSVFAGTNTPGFKNGPRLTAEFYMPQGMMYDPNTDVAYVADARNAAIRSIDSDGNVKTLTGSNLGTNPVYGYKDGPLADALFGFRGAFLNIKSGVVDKEGNIYVIDAANRAIRKIILK